MKGLNPMALPLTGQQLIEASAGTGKTYTIASLYLRLLLEERPDTGEPLTPTQILVVTFTRAATAELRDRIRRRILSAIHAFRIGDGGKDDLLSELLATYQGQEQEVLQRLDAAEKSMDEAAVFTIHGFCQRMLSHHAFESGGSFEVELLEDDRPLKYQACCDFWRRAVYPQDEATAAYLIQLLGSPEALLGRFNPLFSRKALTLQPPPVQATTLEAAIAATCEQALDSVRALLAHIRTQLDTLEEEMVALLGTRSARTVRNHAQTLRDWAAENEPGYGLPESACKARDYLIKKHQEKVANEGAAPLDSVLQFQACFESTTRALEHNPLLFSSAYDWIGKAIEAEKRRLRALAPDDLLGHLQEALAHPTLGGGLAARIRRCFPVAMIDEFQDTDPLQYAIFSRIYRDHPDQALLMIGDPKQAIYAFRGADVFTYMQAKSATATDNRHTLMKNYRSTRSMVAGVNALFEHADAPFIFDQQIGFDPVDSHHQDPTEALTVEGNAQPALTFWHLDDSGLCETDKKAIDRNQLLSEQTAERISQLLNAALSGATCLGDRPVQPKDIAVLIRDRFEAERIRDALSRRGIRSAYLSRDNVFATPVAAELLRVLQAIREPRNTRYLLASLSGTLLGLSFAELHRVRADEQTWQQHQARHQRYHELWEEKGIMACLRTWMSDYQVPQALLNGQANGERDLTDLQHLAELLQEKARTLQGAPALLHWFADALATSRPEAEKEQLRLESDQDLIQIVTIHRSKGLEYPVVLLPFAASARVEKKPLYHDHSSHQACYDFNGDEQTLATADLERLAEDLRLLYVALTRARHCCFVGVNRAADAIGPSALGYLLEQSRLLQASAAGSGTTANAVTADTAAPTQDRISQVVKALIDQAGKTAIGLEALQEVAVTPYSASPAGTPPGFGARQFSGQIDRSWRSTSYSSLARNHAQVSLHPGVDDEPSDERVDERDGAGKRDRFSFPRGAKAGDFLHQVLEQQQFADSQPGQLADIVERQLKARSYQEPDLWQPVVTAWMEAVLATPLDDSGFRLGDLPGSRAYPEMEFHLPIEGLACQPFNRLLARYPLLQTKTGGLRFQQVKGMLKGFIDLVFEHDGRYYVADYKSNHLGGSFAQYHAPQLDAAMAEHRYDLQLVIYTLALHRFLRLQLGEQYSYDTHIGGGYYLFLRGMSADQASRPGVFFRKPERALIEALDRWFAGDSQAIEPLQEVAP